MLVRLLLSLLLIVGAVPMAPCHAAAPSAVASCPDAAMPSHRHAPAADHGLADHGCVGCAALDDWLADRVEPPVAVAAARLDGASPSLFRSPSPPPLPRPPQAG